MHQKRLGTTVLDFLACKQTLFWQLDVVEKFIFYLSFCDWRFSKNPLAYSSKMDDFCKFLYNLLPTRASFDNVVFQVTHEGCW